MYPPHITIVLNYPNDFAGAKSDFGHMPINHSKIEFIY